MIDARHSTLLTMIAGGVLWSGAAFAQSAPVLPAQAADASVDMFTRNRNTAVQQRQRPDYEARGLRAGAFTVYPKVDWAVEYNDNVYAASTNEQSDTVIKIRPELAVESNWSQNSLNAYVRGSVNRYVDLKTENTDEYGFGVSGRIDVTRLSRLSAGADYADTYEPRTAPNAPAGARLDGPRPRGPAHAHADRDRRHGRRHENVPSPVDACRHITSQDVAAGR